MIRMDSEETDRIANNATVIETVDQGSFDEDDYVSAELLRTASGQIVIRVTSSGFNSSFSGAGGFGALIDEEQAKNWTELIEQL